MNDQPINQESKLQTIAKQNKKMRKKLLIVLAISVGVVAVLVAVLLIVQACQAKKEEAFSLPDNYFRSEERRVGKEC